MDNVMGIALSGMRAAQQGVQVAAHNVANLATPMPSACSCSVAPLSRVGCRPR